MRISFAPQPHVARRMKHMCRRLFFALVFSLVIPLSLAGSAGADQTDTGEKMDFVAVAYTSPDFQGVSWRIPAPGLYDLWKGFDLPNDSICSIAAAPGYTITLYEHSKFEGESESMQGAGDLGKRKRWASSLKVEKTGKTDNDMFFEWFRVQLENMGIPAKIEIDPETASVAKALEIHADRIDTFQKAMEPHWYGTTTDAERIALADELLKIFSDCGVDVDEWEPNTFAQQINNFFDWRKNLSVWDTACLILNVDPERFKVEKTEAEAAKDFIRQLQTLAAEDKRQELAGLVSYPLNVNKKPAMEIKNADAFVKNYDALFTEAVQECLRGHDLDEDVFVRNQVEYMVGDGCIWFSPDDKGNMAMFVINP